MGKAQVIEQRRPETLEAPEEPTCKHHWLIETPRGSMSSGRCKVCGEQREFRNSTTDYVWDDDSGSGYNPWRGQRSPKVAEDDEVAASPKSVATAVLV